MDWPNPGLMTRQTERSQLCSIVRSHASRVRWCDAQIVLLAATGRANREVVGRCGVSAPVVSLMAPMLSATRHLPTTRVTSFRPTAQR
jgi:hypothetical protein